MAVRVGVAHRSTPSRQSVNALVIPNAGRVCPLQPARGFLAGVPRLFLWTLNGEIPKGPLKKMLPVFVGILLEILDQHNLVAGLVVHQLIPPFVW